MLLQINFSRIIKKKKKKDIYHSIGIVNLSKYKCVMNKNMYYSAFINRNKIQTFIIKISIQQKKA